MTDATVLEYQSPKTQTGFYYGWVNLVVAAVAMVATMPGRPQGLGLITKYVLLDLHIDPVYFATQNVWANLIGSCFSLAIGPLIDWVGARLVLALTMAALGVTVVAMSRVTGPVGLLIMLTLSRGFGQSALSVVSLALVGKWFSRRLPIAMGIYAVLVCIGFIVVFTIAGHVVDLAAWRHFWAMTGWIIFAGAAVSWFVVRRSPESVGQVLDGNVDRESAGQDELQTGFTLQQALRSPAFWAYASAASIFGMISAAVMLFNQILVEEHGLDVHAAANVMIIITFAGLIANVLAGLLGQVWRMGWVLALGMLLLAISLLCLPAAHGKTLVYLYAILMGIAGGIVTVAFFSCWGKVFGRLHLGSIQGAAQGLTVVTASAGPWLLAKCIAVSPVQSSARFFYVLGPIVALLGLFCALAPVPAKDAN